MNFYGGNTLSTQLNDGSVIELKQKTDYPWDGNIELVFGKAPSKEFSLFIRIPAWADNTTVSINGKPSDIDAVPGKYAEIRRLWKSGDRVELILPMQVDLIEANPLVEETRNQVAVRRGPVVYCLESADIPAGNKIFDIALPADVQFTAAKQKIDMSTILTLSVEALVADNLSWDGQLYRKISREQAKKETLKLIPYYAWGNRGKGDMTVWLPLKRDVHGIHSIY